MEDALVSIGGKHACNPLIKVLEADNDFSLNPASAILWRPKIQRRAAETLGKLGDLRAVEPLIKALSGGNECAATALGKLGDPRAVAPLIKALSGGDGCAATALGKLGDPRAVEPLITALCSKNLSFRKAAAEALISLAGSHPAWFHGRWRYVAELVESPHYDAETSQPGEPSNCVGVHSDRGIGLSFPPPPPGEDF